MLGNILVTMYYIGAPRYCNNIYLTSALVAKDDFDIGLALLPTSGISYLQGLAWALV